MIESLFFYLLSFTIIIAALMVITVSNTVHAVLWLIFSFFTSAGLFLLVNAEFLAMLIIIVYVGAVAVLFLFVVMMLEIDIKTMRDNFYKRLFLGILIAGIFLIDLLILITISLNTSYITIKSNYPLPTINSTITNTQAIGQILYTDFMLPFQLAGMILFTAMIGCIALTLRRGRVIKRQNVNQQNARNKSNSVELISNITKGGIDV